VGKIVTTALLYSALVFGAGLLLGPIRALLIEPLLGPVAATLCEAPIMIAVTVFAAWWTPRVTGLNRQAIALVLVGVIALVFQQAADLAVDVLLRGISVTGVLVHFATPEGAIYAILLALFAAMPWLIVFLGRGVRSLIPRARS
jgi:hypothetical protein